MEKEKHIKAMGASEKANIKRTNKEGHEVITKLAYEKEDYSYERAILCHSIAGLPIPVITVTALPSKKYPVWKWRAIIISSWVHPGESNSSFVFNGFYKFILSNEAWTLWRLFIFKMIPVLNPDGVVCGNYRSSIAGVDLNWQWGDPNPIIHPSIYHLKKLVKRISIEWEVFLFCDIHSHSRKRNSFLYGNKKAANGGFLSWTKVWLLPWILARRCEMFNYKGCWYKV